jgi:SAM-dependent methyltransferase
MYKTPIDIQSEYSSQRLSHPPNPAIAWSLAKLSSLGYQPPFESVADVGCGKLRHFASLFPITRQLVLVDTEKQLSAMHTDRKQHYTIYNYARKHSTSKRTVLALSDEEFAESKLSLKLIFCVAVFDVVPRSTRLQILDSCASHLAPKGHFVIIVPRNDQSITSRCSHANKYLDGHCFVRQGITTFFHNFDKSDALVRDCKARGLSQVSDISRYRQLCLVFTKP